MSWKAGVSRHLPILRFFACLENPSSKGIRTWYYNNYEEITYLNPNFPFLLRTTDNAMPAVTTDLEWTTDHLLKFMIETGRFRDPNGTIAENRVEAAKAYLATDWNNFHIARLQCPGFDPEDPSVEKNYPGWRDDPSKTQPLQKYIALKDATAEQMNVIQSGPNDEYERARCALMMTERVDLWCAGEKEVDMAVQHLYKLARILNEREMGFPRYIQEFYAGIDDVGDE